MAPSAQQALEGIVLLCERDARKVGAFRVQADGLAETVGGEVALRWYIVALRAALLAPPDDDSIREAYGALVDEHRDDAAAMALLRPLGDEIRTAEAEGRLPSSLVVRSPRRGPRP
jgi:hypothetical protein